MKTVVETYIIEETQELIYDNEKLDQWNALVAELGLTGQTKIRVADKSPIPFLHMKSSLVLVFETLCPRKVKVQDYDKTPIPVEILGLVALSTKEKYFDGIEIWYDDKTPDPACIGLRRNTNFDPKFPTWERGFDRYLIGRWADVKQSLEALTDKAKALFIAKQKSTIEDNIIKEQRKLEDLGHLANEAFGYNTNTADKLDGLSSLPF